MAMGRSSSLCPDLVTQATCTEAPQSHVVTTDCTGIQVASPKQVVNCATGRSHLCCKAFYVVLLSVKGILCDKEGKVGILNPQCLDPLVKEGSYSLPDGK